MKKRPQTQDADKVGAGTSSAAEKAGGKEQQHGFRGGASTN